MDGAPSWAEYGAVQKDECRELLNIFREKVMALVDRPYACGDLIYRKGDHGNALYVVTEGVVKLSGSYSGDRDFMFLLGPWDIFGPLGAAKEPVRRVQAEAFTGCRIVKVPKIFVERAMRRQPEVALRLMTLQDIRLIQYEELIGCLLSRRTEARLANLLSILAQKFGEHSDVSHTTIGLWLTHRDLAEMIASTRESITKTLNDLRNRKMIGMKGGRITILNPQELAKIGRR
ncbi:MAG: Crp/Fnr family transcriptional regulator [Actinomycetota bacterium]|nr:Crp/Fnr family transcriptional regulator [Actinomycetota bacterium]